MEHTSAKREEPPEIINRGLFRSRLLETMAWCDSFARIRRSKLLKPSNDFFDTRFENERACLVTEVAEKRVEGLSRAGLIPNNNSESSRGRLLLYAPDDNLFDGAAELQSKGFFDVNNVPPWDCWVIYFHPYLVSWIPQICIDLAQAGIDVNPEQCILWADEVWRLEPTIR